jgi:hypothetical protein
MTKGHGKSARQPRTQHMSVVNVATEIERHFWYRSCVRIVSPGEDVGVYSCGDPGDAWWAIPFFVSPAHDLCDNSHLSVGDSDSFLVSPSITDVDLHWVTAAFDHIDVEIEY